MMRRDRHLKEGEDRNMEMNSIKEALPNCPRCGRHCPIDAVSCNRGKELVEKLMNGEMTLEAATQADEGKYREGHSHEGHHHGGHHHHE